MSTLQNQLAIIGIAAHGSGETVLDSINRLYQTGSILSDQPLAPLDQLIDDALADARIAPQPDMALLLLGDAVSSRAWSGPVYALQTLPQALVFAGDLIAERLDRSVVLAVSGSGALVLCHEQSGARIYAQIAGCETDPATALAAANCDPAAVGCLTVNDLVPDDATTTGPLVSAYRTPDSVPTCALNSVSGSGLTALIQSALSVYHRIIPTIPDWSGPADLTLWQNSPFYVMPRSKTWFREIDQPLRHAAVHTREAHIILAEQVDGQYRPNSALQNASLKLFIVTADSVEALLTDLRGLAESAQHGTSLQTLADEYAVAYQQWDRSASTAVVLAHDAGDLAREIQSALTGIPAAVAQGGEWFTPRGSYFTTRPLGPDAPIAFVYPGAFNSYPRMTQDLFHLFPNLHEDMGTCIANMGESVGDHLVYPRFLEKQTARHRKLARENLEASPITVIEAGIASSMAFTRVLRDVFHIQPDMALGYSLGETSMLFALDVWQDCDAGHNALHTSDLYRDRLFGAKKAARAMWGLPPDAANDFWHVYFVAASPDDVLALVEHEPHVYLTHINTEQEVVIAGEPAACQRVLAALDCDHMQAAFDSIIHCDVTFSEYERFYKLHDFPVTTSAVAFYSAADYAPLEPLEQAVIAHSITRMVCKTLDFPRLTERVYADGTRIFIELGPRSTCARWISEALGERDHLSVSINHLGVDDHTALLRMLARLVAHGVALDVSPLFTPRVSRPSIAVPRWDTMREPYSHVTQAHQTFLQKRLEGLHQLGDLLQLQMQTMIHQPAAVGADRIDMPVAVPAPVDSLPEPVTRPARPALFDERALAEFATGSIVACFGPEYTVYENRRAPRIPNGDLLLMSRVVHIEGERHDLTPGSWMVSEYDVPRDPWFYRDNAVDGIPYSVYMEMALQLCGFLSAYLGSSLIFPNLDFYFRNLDGQGTLYKDIDLRGQTISNTVHMTSSITLEGIIIQKFTFQLDLAGEVFYEGEASFGFFTAQAMQSQAGLDKGQPVLPWYQREQHPFTPIADPARYYRALPGKPHYRLAQPGGQLDLVDTYLIEPDSGEYGQGYVYASKQLDPTNWFFYAHFHEDPVMPGSLGVEAILQAMQAFALELDLGRAFTSPRFQQATPQTTVWHYRGQVTRENRYIAVEIHIKRIETTPEHVTIIGDASLWRDDGLRIYEVLDIALRIQESA